MSDSCASQPSLADLRSLQAATGATFTEQAGASVPNSFGTDQAALTAVKQGVALCDRTHWGRIQLTGSDRIRYLHNQSTNDFYRLQPGQGCDTVFVTSTARTIDLVTAYVQDDQVLLIVSPNRREQMMAWLDRYIFPADNVELQDVTASTAMFSLIGPQSDALLAQLGGKTLANHEYGNHQRMILTGIDVQVAVGNGLGLPGCTLIVSMAQAAPLWNALSTSGAVSFGETIWEYLRIEQGRPLPEHELTEDYNPLEAGLGYTISLEKGCYIGQETIAKLNTYKGIKQKLWGIRLNQPVASGTPILLGDEKIGKLTSITQTSLGWLGLGYIRTKAGGEGLKVTVEDAQGDVIAVPFLTHDS
jgi:tRNA-modifying protein YgfZ